MRKDLRPGTSHPWPREGDSEARLSAIASDESSSSDSEAPSAAQSVMKRSRGFSTSFSFEEDPQLLSDDDDTQEEEGEEESAKELEKPDAFLGGSRPLRSGVLRPGDLWLAMSQCLAFRWPPCLSLNRPGKNLAAQSAGKQPSANENPSRPSPSRDRNVMREKEDVPTKGAKSGPAPFRGISRSSPTLPSTRLASDLASVLLERETFLRIELVDAGEGGEDSRFRAEWKLSETTEDLAEGVWFSRNQRTTD
ncbi:dystrobrevin binding protein 1b isoform X1 [Phyllopteryx taeniolatus]|uniref:dystrobrevin binding protein 1b isoform X1 n=1 Tax=Phyllopteryx taeniolatus TaxID=161469 RepID=UPI002AD57E45|nr:dystrobrevin binding protein 1b isoform X1 [Phyllopteryx taeniolatus]XP_061615681.1 dystrobrevin binding protein 1b isoform X1 [Phyllopteryx taeniolatus]XP_061615682.1 dystrobrevin binding protein 1b isoform X1 [Phyllopteryx taeniolatus]XP_061615683.1 dystrobrevin binding protein 1b isoform X1 [Phyllopteryx taeniolatus]XP_061615684.1 dystrobrevin binding protein 1b isoform X1 [Phyllopteryx taeniolatus]XP_061615685.1 dystrobrevin binding protein 1b isoform X1 [Phyllopteryx taeniolatus]XP_06